MKIPIDVNLSPLWISYFASAGLEAVHWVQIGSCSAPDSAILEYAGSRGMVLFTHDLDFGTLLSHRGLRGPSVIQVRGQDVLPASIGPVALQAISSARSHLEQGALVTVELNKCRVRILPI